MSPNLIVALVVLPLAGALIAWAGDVIGYRLGKSRRSMFGLRPRTTATLVGVLLGAALPLAGLLFAMAVSQDARDALLRIDQLRDQADTLATRNANLNLKTARAEDDAQKARKQARAAEGERKRALTRLAATGKTLATARTGLQSARGKLQQTRRDLTVARQGLGTAQGELSQARDLLASASQELDRVGLDLRQTEDDLKRTSSKLESASAEMHKITNLRREIELAQEYRDDLQTDLARTEEELARYKRERVAVVEQQVAFEPDDELVRGIVESGWSSEQLEAILEELLNYASTAAASHGIAPGPNGRSLRVVSPLPPDVPLGELTEANVIAEVGHQIARGDAPTYVVIVRAWDGAFEHQAQPMTAQLWVAPNKVVFDAGETILSTIIDGGLPRDHVFRELWQTARDVRRIAGDRGMLPSPKSGHYVEVPANELLDAMDTILELGRPARVRIVVEQEARVAQPEDAPMEVIGVEPE